VAHLHAEAADEIKRLRAMLQGSNIYGAGENAARLKAEAEIERLRAERDALVRALHEIAEEWCGAECGEPVHAQEAYAIALAKRMYTIAVEARKP
jgi:hypothetical protein